MAVIHKVWTTGYKIKDTPIRIIDSTGLPDVSTIKGYYTGGIDPVSTATRTDTSTMGRAALEDLYKQSETAASDSQSFYNSPAPCQVCFGNCTKLTNDDAINVRIRVQRIGNKLYLQSAKKVGAWGGYADLSIWDFYNETTAPDDVYVKFWLMLQGGGGGGAPGYGGRSTGGGGGGSGGLLLAPFKLQAGEELFVTIGNGGVGARSSQITSAGYNKNSGGDGENTTVALSESSTTYLAIAHGGKGGKLTLQDGEIENKLGGDGGAIYYNNNTVATSYSYSTIVKSNGVSGGAGSNSNTTYKGEDFPASKVSAFQTKLLDYTTAVASLVDSHSGGIANGRGGGGAASAFGDGGVGGTSSGKPASPATGYGVGGGGGSYSAFSNYDGASGMFGAAWIIY